MVNLILFPPFRKSFFRTTFILLALGFTGSLIAAPSIVSNNFESVFGLDNTLSGSQGGSSIVIEIDYSSDVLSNTIGVEDLTCEGTSGDAIGKTIPITFQFAFNKFPGPLRTGRYTLGPLDSAANGTYSLKIVADQVTTSGFSPEAVPAGEILLFTQNVNDPVPAILDVRFDPPLDGEGNMTGPLGFERPKLIIDFNKDVATNTIHSSDFEIVGSGSASGVTISTLIDYPITELEDKTTVELILGPLDIAQNGDYTVTLLKDSIEGIGDLETFVPDGLVVAYTQNIVNPPPRILTELNGFPLGGFPTATSSGGYQIMITYNYVVDTNEIDAKDIKIVGKSENINGLELTVTEVDFNAQNFPGNDAYVTASYIIGGFEEELKEALNGEWEVQIVENEVLDKESPPRALPAQVVGTFIQDVTDPFRVTLKGRAFEEMGTPSLVDDGHSVDPGLSMNFRLETLKSGDFAFGGFGYQDLSLQSDAFKSSLTGLCLPAVVTDFGDPLERVFQIPAAQSNNLIFGSQFMVTGSTGNDGTYTVKSNFADWNVDPPKAYIFVDEAIPSDVSDGKIIKAETYVGKVTIDGGTPIDLAIDGRNAATYGELFDEINAQLGDAGTIVQIFNSVLRIESSSFGASSSVLIDETATPNNLFACLQGNGGDQAFPDPSVPGSDEWSGAPAFNELFALSEADYGKFQYLIETPGRFRLQTGIGEIYDPETDTFNWIPLFPEWIVQALGDPTREGEPKDHYMYFDVTREMQGETVTVNFSYVEENESPEAIEDDADFDLAFKVPANSFDFQLDVLKNDTVNGAPPQPGDLTIIGLSPDLELSTDTTSVGSRIDSTITTDGEFVYYTPYPGFAGWELFYYTIEDKDGKKDFAPVYVFVTFGPIETQVLTLDDRFQVLPGSSDNALNVLGNDFTVPPGNNSALSITGLGLAAGSTETTTVGSAGGTITITGGQTVTYTPVADFEGTESFYYDVSDGNSGTGSAQVIVSVIPDETELNPVIGNYSNELGRLMSRTAQGRRLLSLFAKYAPEFYAILVGNPEIGGQVATLAARLGMGIQVTTTGNRIQLAVDVGSGGEVLKTFNALQDGAAAFLSGQGSEVTLTQEIIDQAVVLRELIYEEASEEMKVDIDAELGNLESKVGQNFDQFFETFGVDSDDVSLIVYNPLRRESEFLVTVANLDGFNYTLWKTKTLRSDDWAVVEEATIQYFPTYAVITDPNPGEGQTFYRLQREIETTE